MKVPPKKTRACAVANCQPWTRSCNLQHKAVPLAKFGLLRIAFVLPSNPAGKTRGNQQKARAEQKESKQQASTLLLLGHTTHTRAPFTDCPFFFFFFESTKRASHKQHHNEEATPRRTTTAMYVSKCSSQPSNGGEGRQFCRRGCLLTFTCVCIVVGGSTRGGLVSSWAESLPG